MVRSLCCGLWFRLSPRHSCGPGDTVPARAVVGSCWYPAGRNWRCSCLAASCRRGDCPWVAERMHRQLGVTEPGSLCCVCRHALARIAAAPASQPGSCPLFSLMGRRLSVTPWGQGEVGAGHPASGRTPDLKAAKLKGCALSQWCFTSF